jgi:hypothetical protein
MPFIVDRFKELLKKPSMRSWMKKYNAIEGFLWVEPLKKALTRIEIHQK